MEDLFGLAIMIRQKNKRERETKIMRNKGALLGNKTDPEEGENRIYC